MTSEKTAYLGSYVPSTAAVTIATRTSMSPSPFDAFVRSDSGSVKSGVVKRASNASVDHAQASFHAHHQQYQQSQPHFSPLHGLSTAVAPHDPDASSVSGPHHHGGVPVQGGGQHSRYGSGDSAIYDSTWFSSSSSSLMSPTSPTNETGYYSSGSAGDAPMLPYPPHYYQPDPRQYRFYNQQGHDAANSGWPGKLPMSHFGQPIMPLHWGAGGQHVFAETTVDPKALLSGGRAPSAPPSLDKGQISRAATPGYVLKSDSAPSMNDSGKMEVQGQDDEDMSGDESEPVESKRSTVGSGLNPSNRRKMKRLSVKMPAGMPAREDEADESEFADMRAYDAGVGPRYRRDDRLASERKRRDALSLAFIEIRGLLPPEIQKLPKSKVLEYAAGAIKEARADAAYWKKEFDALIEATAGHAEDYGAIGAASSHVPLGLVGPTAADPRSTAGRARGRSRVKRS